MSPGTATVINTYYIARLRRSLPMEKFVGDHQIGQAPNGWALLDYGLCALGLPNGLKWKQI